MKGVILAGGRGSRLGDTTRVVNKHLLPVYDRPMIYYPIATLRAMGVDDILIVTGGEQVGGFAQLLGGGFTYRVQERPDGIAGALTLAEGYVDGLFPVILGDNYFSTMPAMPSEPAIFTSPTDRPQAFGIYDPGSEQIVEKPTNPPSNLAVTGLYVYDTDAFQFIRTMTPSARGELEITDLNNAYLRCGLMDVREAPGLWSDMGTPDSLLIAALHAKENARAA
ncbi:sugar phosphate nucleotidyltransferase [Streptomyces sp. NPDC004610]|uniref:sugar phosphate nucleotidyltransferase n=1 Tax=unclassified Streptomyces TaxID=2593676 RepID=UPI0033B1624E